MEAASAFSQTHEHRDPYKIVNKLGFGILFLIDENKKIFMEDLIQQLVSKNGEKDFLPHFQQNGASKERIKKQKNLIVNFVILKPQKEQ